VKALKSRLLRNKGLEKRKNDTRVFCWTEGAVKMSLLSFAGQRLPKGEECCDDRALLGLGSPCSASWIIVSLHQSLNTGLDKVIYSLRV
jgi:hypothetical protein